MSDSPDPIGELITGIVPQHLVARDAALAATFAGQMAALLAVIGALDEAGALSKPEAKSAVDAALAGLSEALRGSAMGTVLRQLSDGLAPRPTGSPQRRRH